MMAKINTIIVDDEFLALDLLEAFILRMPDLHLVGKAKTPIEAQRLLDENEIQLVFTDIQMPVMTGINFVKTMTQNPIIIFTTAFSEHALEAFDLNAIDYLLKPFTFERFVQSVNKATRLINKKPDTKGDVERNINTTHITVKSEGKIIKLKLDDIDFVESMKEYVQFHGDFGKFLVLERLKNILHQLPSERFIKVHKSFIVATTKVEALNGNLLEIKGHQIPISRDLKKEVVEKVFG